MSDPAELPNAVEAEKGVLSCCLQWPDLHIPKARSLQVGNDSWYVPAHRVLWELLDRLSRENQPIEMVSLSQSLKDAGQLENIGGAAELAMLWREAATEAHFEQHCSLVREKHALRIGLRGLHRASVAVSEGGDSQTLLRALREAQAAIERTSSARTASIPLREALLQFGEDFAERATGEKEAPRLPTGIEKLDEATAGGLGLGWQVIICGKSKGGKSILGAQLATHYILQGKNVVIFSLEMLVGEIVERMVANQSGVNVGTIANPARNLPLDRSMRRVELKRIQKAVGELNSGGEAWFIDDPRTDIDGLCEEVRNLNMTHGVDVIVTDYLQLVRGDASNGREREVASVSGDLKRLAMETEAVSIALSQLNDDGRTRESRAIIQDANLAIECDAKNGACITAQRQGPSGVDLELWMNGGLMRFEPA